LTEDAIVLLEIDETQGQKVSAMVNEVLPTADVNLFPDLAGFDRYVSIRSRG
jgi:hypothetical protein